MFYDYKNFIHKTFFFQYIFMILNFQKVEEIYQVILDWCRIFLTDLFKIRIFVLAKY